MGKLIRLELYNFKSYKGHHVLLFGNSYFTSIIGPNGSGKSNSMDAISFVLGIKSSHLRSSHLKDLVYRGRVLKTSTINGDGSATINHANGHGADLDGFEHTQSTSQERHDPKSAWVMAVYEDDAGDEQHWKRTITSQGSSEYRINGSVVTAQQYNTALETENILIKARNFLVFQGDVEQIASQSPKDLTRLIEQISGSLEYKAEYERLKETLEAAVETQNYSLNRRRGINSEIKQYQEQKREADSYAKKAEQRDQAVVTHILWKLYHFQRIIEESSTEIKKHQEELKEHRRSIAKYEKNLEDARQEQAKVTREVGKVERNVKRKEKDVEELEDSLVPILEKIYLSKENLVKANARIAGIQKELDSRSDNIKRLRKDLRTVDKAEEQWETEWRKLGEQEGRILTETDLQEYSKLREEVGKRTSAYQMLASNLQRHQRTDEETIKSMKSKVDTIDYQVKQLRDGINETKEHMRNVKELIGQTSADIEGRKKDLNNLTSERLRSAQIRTELDEKLQDVLTKLLDVEDGRKQNDKETRLKATIADMKRIFPGVRGRVNELCKPKQKRYAEAVATVLGRHFDAVVVDDEKTAKECIQYLRDQHRGQATFIPLDTIQVKAVNSSLKGLHRGTRMALDTIDYDKAVDRAMSYACGNAIVCDDLAIAKYVCYDRGVDAKAVTLDGTVIHKGGLMTGGRGQEQGVRRWEDTEVDNLRKLAEKLQRELAALPESRRNATAEEALQGELTGLEQRLAYAKEEAKGHGRNLSSKQNELYHVEKELSQIKPRYEAKVLEFEEARVQLQSYQAAVSEVEDDVFRDYCQRLEIDNIRTFEAQQGSLQQEGAQKKLEFKQQRSKLESRINFEEQQLQETKNRVNVLTDRCTLDQSLIANFEAQRSSISSKIDILSAELHQLQEQLDNLKVLQGSKTDKVAEQRREVQKRSKSVEGTTRAIASLESEIHRNAVSRYTLLRKCKLEDITIPLADDSRSLNQLPIEGAIHADPDAMDVDGDQDQSSFQPAVVQDYGIEVHFETLDEALRKSSDEKLDEELQARVSRLEDELRQMAPNMRAIERLEGVESRLKTVEREFEEARKSAKRARDDFQEVKERRFELFNKAFTHISEQIGPIYKDLTRSASLPMGGQAYLDMEDSDEPYLDGIKYHAMPPLKRFRDMEHLSGGEKTIAALALLFAIHSYQPSPFFVLDEVDAALDNANVAKIANYIRDHAGPGMQFIVISLKTGLFQGSEALVGIHRDQGANTSKALTLDLRRYQ